MSLGLGFASSLARLVRFLRNLRLSTASVVPSLMSLESLRKGARYDDLARLEHRDDVLDAVALELLVDAREVDRALDQKLHLRQRPRVLGVLAVVLPVDHLLDLARPVDEGRLEALDEVLLLRRRLESRSSPDRLHRNVQRESSLRWCRATLVLR